MAMLEQPKATLDGEWWKAPDYSHGDLDLPGQSALAAGEKKTLEAIAAAADGGKLDIQPMPKAALEAMKALRAGDPDIDQVVGAIELDPALSLLLIKHANSALYAPRYPIDSIRRAVVHVGMKQLKTIVQEVSLRAVTGNIKARHYAVMEWRQAIHCALISKAMARRVGADEEAAYLAGLLHDVGRLPVLNALDKKLALPDVPARGGAPEIIMESLHRGVGAQVARLWELPPAVCDAIAHHLNGRREDEDPTSEFSTTKLAEAAGDLCHALGLGRFRRPFHLLSSRSFRDAGFTPDALEDFLRTDLPKAVESAASIG